jgi:cytochrome c oxidase subunit 3
MYLYRIGDKPNYQFPWPSTLWLSTAAIIGSSLTLWLAQKAVARTEPKTARMNLGLTVGLGSVFVFAQLLSWILLAQSGVYAQTNPFAGLFYILTAVHGFHLLVGIGWIIYLYYLAKFGELKAKRHLALDLGAAYWHFMMIVWLVFFGLIVL